MEILEPAKYSFLQSQGTPGFARSMQKLAIQESEDVAVFRERKLSRLASKGAAIEASWPPVRITRSLGVYDANIEQFIGQIDDDHADIGRAVPRKLLEITIVGPSEMAKMLTSSRSKIAMGTNPSRMKRVVTEDLDVMNKIITGLRDEQVAVDILHEGAETPDLWLRSIYPDAIDWPDDVADLPLIDESGLILHGLWAKAEFEMGSRLETVGTDTLAVELSGPSAQMVVEERRLVLEALHSRLSYDTTLADRSYTPKLEVFKTQADKSLIGPTIVQPSDMPYYIPFNEPRAIQSKLFVPTV